MATAQKILSLGLWLAGYPTNQNFASSQLPNCQITFIEIAFARLHENACIGGHIEG
jgi:hypothetical protein